MVSTAKALKLTSAAPTDRPPASADPHRRFCYDMWNGDARCAYLETTGIPPSSLETERLCPP